MLIEPGWYWVLEDYGEGEKATEYRKAYWDGRNWIADGELIYAAGIGRLIKATLVGLENGYYYRQPTVFSKVIKKQ